MPQDLATTWRLLAGMKKDQSLPRGLDAAWDSVAGWIRNAATRTQSFLRRAGEIIALEKDYAQKSDAALGETGRQLREIFRRSRDTREHLNHAYALVREVAARKLDQKHFPVQIAGALALHAGCVVEMATGEGKTLAATMPTVAAGWRGKGCHVITVNDYLAKRDAEWMGPVYKFLGLSVGYIRQDMSPPLRKRAYQADITYCTNKEVTADFLRDRLTLGRVKNFSQALLENFVGGRRRTDRLLQRGLHYAIVDEADSVLIDEAVTPLIISGEAPNPEQVHAFTGAAELAEKFQPDVHYKINHRYREVELTSAGKSQLERETAGLGGVWQGRRRSEELIVQALTAREFYLRDQQYVLQEDKAVIVDEFTGRLMPDREWRDGLHQAVEAKEGVEVNPPKDTYARLSFQRFFRLYGKLAGMTGTAAEARREFWQIYHLPVAVIPTNRPCIRKVHPDRVYADEQAKWSAVLEEIKRVHATDRPVLVGTRSVRASEHLSRMLSDEGLDHQVLNAVRHKQEAHIVAGAGQKGRITVATNMAGRGTDIKLAPGVAEMGGLKVIATERHEAGRIDRQLFGRCARQGDPGEAVAFVSLEDELPRRYAPTMTGLLRRRFAGADGEVSSRLTRRVFDVAQRRAERLALRQRKSVLRTDDWLDEYLGFAGSES